MTTLSFGYPKTRVFTDLSLSAPAGHIYGLFGQKRGPANHTLLKLISGLCFAQKGEVAAFGALSAKRKISLLRRLFYLPEQICLPPFLPERYVGLYAPLYPRFDAKRFSAHAQNFALDLTRRLNAYSMGQKKKFLLAFGLATGCDLLLLDEPTAGLDIPSKQSLRKAMAGELTRDRLFMVATHQVRDLENIIDAVVILDAGKIVHNRLLMDTTARLSTRLQTASPDPKDALHVQKVPGGYCVVTERQEEEETDIDLETLFNTVLARPQRVAALFEKEADEK